MSHINPRFGRPGHDRRYAPGETIHEIGDEVSMHAEAPPVAPPIDAAMKGIAMRREELSSKKAGSNGHDAPPAKNGNGAGHAAEQSNGASKILETAMPGNSIGKGKKKAEGQPGFRMTTKWLLWSDPSDSEKPEIVVSGPFEVIAESQDDSGYSWGVLLRWKDPAGRSKDWAMPRSLLAGDGLEVRRVLLDGGLYIGASGKARGLFTTYLASVHVKTRAKAVASTGWFGGAFVLPDSTIGLAKDEVVILQTPSFVDHAYNMRGTLAEWQQHVARLAVGNSRLALAVSTAFAACLVGPCGAESGGIHFRGRSSIGKTTALSVAGSVWGGGDRGYIRSWRATSNGIEGTAVIHSDTLLCLDEISQLGGKEAAEVAYMLANNQGKARLSRDASLRKPAHWRLLFLSTGEISLADKIAEDMRGRRQTAGQQVRVVDLPSDTGQHGLFDTPHEFQSAAALADHLRGACNKYYGTAARAFIKAIAPDIDAAADAIKDSIRQFVNDHCPDADCDGQVKRVASRFGLIAAAGELAANLSILPWQSGEARRAASICFKAWVANRGGVEAAEDKDGVAAVRAFLSAHGLSRFVPAWETSLDQKVINLAGFRKRAGEDGDTWDYFVTSEAWPEVAAGFNKAALSETLAKRAFLVQPEKGGKRSSPIKVPGFGLRRVYHISHKIFDGGDIG
jgi:putative DNA primase/helicase